MIPKIDCPIERSHRDVGNLVWCQPLFADDSKQRIDGGMYPAAAGIRFEVKAINGGEGIKAFDQSCR